MFASDSSVARHWACAFCNVANPWPQLARQQGQAESRNAWQLILQRQWIRPSANRLGVRYGFRRNLFADQIGVASGWCACVPDRQGFARNPLPPGVAFAFPLLPPGIHFGGQRAPFGSRQSTSLPRSPALADAQPVMAKCPGRLPVQMQDCPTVLAALAITIATEADGRRRAPLILKIFCNSVSAVSRSCPTDIAAVS